ncbi:hypothetical protein E4U30_005598 [Claviceps sp. LM220 group G6]|nr:hypothetical protein E4U30_005598 [Claviceps sp. LM220 group G6]KAG6094938.1 hypothetical protein E4U31_006075 [Claviceps sp. LM219 group G6]
MPPPGTCPQQPPKQESPSPQIEHLNEDISPAWLGLASPQSQWQHIDPIPQRPTPQDLADRVAYLIDLYAVRGTNGLDLLLCLQDDFKGWTIGAFMEIPQDLLGELRDLVQERGVSLGQVIGESSAEILSRGLSPGLAGDGREGFTEEGTVGESLEGGAPVGWSLLAGGGNGDDGTPQVGQAACVSVATAPAFEGLDGKDARYGQVQSWFPENAAAGEYVYGRQCSFGLDGLEGASEWSPLVHYEGHEPLVYPFVPWSPAQVPGIDDQQSYFDVPLQAPIQREPQAHGPRTDSLSVRPLAQQPGRDGQQQSYREVPRQPPIQEEPHSSDTVSERPLGQGTGNDAQQECYYRPPEPLADYNAVDKVLRDAASSYRPTERVIPKEEPFLAIDM